MSGPYGALWALLAGAGGRADELKPELLRRGRVLGAPTPERPDLPVVVEVDALTASSEEGELSKDAHIGPFELAAGDEVLLLPEDGGQRYLILMRVVKI